MRPRLGNGNVLIWIIFILQIDHLLKRKGIKRYVHFSVCTRAFPFALRLKFNFKSNRYSLDVWGLKLTSGEMECP